MSEHNHKDCKYYMAANDGCALYFELGAFNVSQYNCCYKKIVWGEDE